jgi:hypothetical protein
MAAVLNGSFTSPLANADLRLPRDSNSSGLLSKVYNDVNGWNIALVFVLALVAYDQCQISPLSPVVSPQ